MTQSEYLAIAAGATIVLLWTVLVYKIARHAPTVTVNGQQSYAQEQEDYESDDWYEPHR